MLSHEKIRKSLASKSKGRGKSSSKSIKRPASPPSTSANRRVFVRSIGSDCNPIRTVIFSCLTKTDIAIGLAMFCKQRSFGTPRTVHHTKSCLKLSFYRSIRIYRVDFEKI